MKIAHLITSLKFGGAESFLSQIIVNLKNNPQVEQFVIYFYDGPIRKTIEDLGIKTYQIKGLFSYYDCYAFYKLVKLLKENKPNIIFSSLWSANFLGSIASSILNIPIICSLHTIYNKEGKLRNCLDLITFKKASKIVTISQDVQKSIAIKSKYLDKIIMIPNGIDINLIQKNTAKYKITKYDLNISNDQFIIGTVGRFVKIKNQDLLIKAFDYLSQKYNNIVLILIGTGPEYHNLKSLIKILSKNNPKLNNKVKIINNQPAYKYLNLLNLFILPSKYEGLSISLLEAMAIKLPCISTSNSTNKGHPVIINNYNGLIIKPDINEIIESIENIYNNVDLQIKLKENSFRTIQEKFNIKNTANLYLNLFNKVYKNNIKS